ncbi:MAG: hypothetical protein M1825_003644 [Sarcosagium campestre]|nr:MAG: hypothetical protein M1825_003644 [Sarcosagium campestre]
MSSVSHNVRSSFTDRRGPSTREKDPAASARRRPPSATSHHIESPMAAEPPKSSDSASNPARRSPAAGTKPDVDPSQLMERRTERIHLTTRENMSVRTRSPVKDSLRKEKVVEKAKGKQRTSVSVGAASQREKEVSHDVWNPQAHLLSPTTAPVASRISLPQLVSAAPQHLQPEPLNQLTPEAQETAILEDLLFVFMGYEGQYIRFVESYNPTEEKDRLAGPTFRILPGLDPSLRDLTTTMLKMATHHIAVQAFINVQSRSEFGTVNHALCAAMRKILKDYLMLIAQLEHQLLTNNSFTLHLLHIHTLPMGQNLMHLYSLAHEVLRKNSLLEDDLEDTTGFDDVENILESLREGGDLAPGNIPGKKVCKGGSVLGLLTRRLAAMSGDPAARALLTTLLREASRPYMVMLNEWLHHGGIRDSHAEFLVKEQKSIRREKLEEDYTDEYWEKRYTIRENDVPPQLEAVKDKVLLAGKYLNVVRECGGVDASKEVKDVPGTFDDVRWACLSIPFLPYADADILSSFLDNVNAAYAHANSSLMNLLLTTHALPARLRSLKHYFFLDRSDFFSYFLELGSTELKKPAKHVNISKLQSLLDLVLRQPGSVAAQDPFKEDVKVQMNEVGLTKWLMRIVSVSGLDQDGGVLDAYQTPAAQASSTAEEDKAIVGFNALDLDYSVPFPLSLVISRKTVLRYQLLFRYLLSLRHLETQLVASWTEHSKAASWRHKPADNPKLELWKRRAWTLRARMLVFVQQLLYFCTAEVIEPNWQGLMARLKVGESPGKADPSGLASSGLGGPIPPQQQQQQQQQVNRTVDELMQDHVDFLDTCLKECMLTNSKLLRIHAKIMTTCTMFATYTSYLTKSLADVSSSSSSVPGAPPDLARLEKLSDNLTKYEENFSRHLRILLDALNYYAATETVVLLGLCARLSTAIEGVGWGPNEEQLGRFGTA